MCLSFSAGFRISVCSVICAAVKPVSILHDCWFFQEIDGFLVNRLQYALLAEAFRLVQVLVFKCPEMCL